MQFYKGQIFHSDSDRESAVHIADMGFEDCEFFSCQLAASPDIFRRSSAERVQITKCRIQGCVLRAVELRDVVIKDLSAPDLFIMWGTLLQRVTLLGRICSLKLNTAVDVNFDPLRQAAFDVARKDFYASIDWALDLTRARLKVFDIKGIPASLIRRDPETQVVIKQDRLKTLDWRGALNIDNYWYPYLNDLETGDDVDRVFAVQMGANADYRRRTKNDLAALRDLGLVEPD